jgi:hypothetical protein
MSLPNVGDVPVVVDLGDYQAFEDVMMPTSMTIAVEGISTTNVMLDSTVVNTTVDESIFTAPAARVTSE